MKKRTKHKISAIIACCMIAVQQGNLSAHFIPNVYAESAENACGSHLTWTYDASKHTLMIEGTGEMNDYTDILPPWSAFANEITVLKLPSALTKIGNHAFENCTALTSVFIPDTVQELGENVFCGCTCLREVVMPRSLIEIPNGAFCGCSSLQKLSNYEHFKIVGEHAFDGCTALQNFKLPPELLLISDYAFRNCSTLTTFEIPDSVDKIGEEAFSGCTNLLHVYITPNSRIIAKDAFENTLYAASGGVTNSKTNAMHFGSARKLTGKQLVVNLFLNEISHEDDGYHFYSAWNDGLVRTNAEDASAVCWDKVDFDSYFGGEKKAFLLEIHNGIYQNYIHSDAIQERLTQIDSALERISDQAKQYGIDDLTFETNPDLNLYFTYQSDGEAAFCTPASSESNAGNALLQNLYSQILQKTDKQIDLSVPAKSCTGMSLFMRQLQSEYEADGLIFLVHTSNSDAVSYSIPCIKGANISDYGEECAVICNGETAQIEQQILKLYGAKDFSDANFNLSESDTEIDAEHPLQKMFSATYFHTSPNIMQEINSLRIDAYTAFLIGWRPIVETEVLQNILRDSSYSLGDIDMDGKLSNNDRNLLSAYLKASHSLNSVQRILAGEGIRHGQQIMNWTTAILVSRLNQMPNYISFSISGNPSYFTVLENDFNFDGKFNADDTALQKAFQNGAAKPNFMQSLLLQMQNKS